MISHSLSSSHSRVCRTIFATWVFVLIFTVIGWKRLLLADGPRQSINALILYSFWQVNNQSWDPEDYLSTDDLLTSILFLTMMFTVLVFAGSVLLLLIAALCYVPLLCYIQGNLKVRTCFSRSKNYLDLIRFYPGILLS